MLRGRPISAGVCPLTGAAVILLAAVLSTGCGIPAGVTVIERAADPLAARVRVSFRDAALPEVLDDLSDAVGLKSAYVRGVERDLSFTFRSRSTTVRGVLDALCRGGELRHDSAEGEVLVAYPRPVDDGMHGLPDEGLDVGFNVEGMPLSEFVESLRRRRAAIWLDPRAADLVPALNIFTTKLRPDWFVLDLIERATGVRYAIVDDTYVLSTPELVCTAMPPERERATPISTRSTPGPDAPGWEEVIELLEYAFALTDEIGRRWLVDAIRSPGSYRAPFHIRPRHGPDTMYGPNPVAAAHILRCAINDRGHRFLRYLTAMVRRGGDRLWPHGIPEEQKPLLTRLFCSGENDRAEAHEAFESRFGPDALRQVLSMKTEMAHICRVEASRGIPYIRPDMALPYVEKLLAEERPVQLGLLGYLRDERTVELLARFLDQRGPDTKTRQSALTGIAILAQPHYHRKWYEYQDIVPWWELDPSQRAGGPFPEAVEVLKKMLNDPDEKVQRAAYHALCRVGGHEEIVVPFLERELASDDFDRDYRAAVSLRFVKSGRALPTLARFCNDEDTMIRSHIAWLLAANGSDRALALLGRAMQGSPEFVYRHGDHIVPEEGRAGAVRSHLGVLGMGFLDDYRTQHYEGMHRELMGMVVEKGKGTLTLSGLFEDRNTRGCLTFVLDPRAPGVREFLDKPLVPQKDNEPFERVLDRALAEAGLARFTSWWWVFISTPELLARGGSWESPIRAKALASLRRYRGSMVRDGLLARLKVEPKAWMRRAIARELEVTYGNDPEVRIALGEADGN